MEEEVNSTDNEEKWAEIVNAWRASGLSKAEFCKKQKVVVSAFYYWCRKLDDDEVKKSPKKKAKKIIAQEKPAFVEITIPKTDSAANTPGQVFRITTSYGAVMEIPL